MLLILLAGIALAARALRGPAPARAARGRADRAGAGPLPQPDGAEAVALVAAVLAIAVAIAIGGRAWDQFSSSDVQFPDQTPSSTSRASPAPAAATSGGSRSTPSAKSRCSATAPAPTSSPGTSCARSTVPVHDAHSLYLRGVRRARAGRRPARPRPWSAALLWIGFCRLARRAATAQRELYAVAARGRWSPSRSAPASTGSGRSPALGAIFFLAAGVLVAGRCAQLAAGAGRRPGAGTALRPRRRRPGGRLDRGDGADRPAAGRPRDQRQPDGGRRRRPRQRRRPRRTRRARSSPGPPRPTCSSACSPSCRANTRGRDGHLSKAIDREERNWQLYYLRSRVEREAGEAAAARRDLEQARELNPLDCPELDETGE